MALDATPGGTASDSYLTVADADAFAASDVGRYVAKWEDAATTTDQKERALKRATQDIDAFIQFSGDKYDADQALLFPRSGDTDAGGSPIIQPTLERACYLQALYVNYNGEVIDDAATRRARGLTNFTEPNVSGQLATSADFGRLAPTVEAVLVGGGFDAQGQVAWIETT